jgi:hypothetical protein
VPTAVISPLLLCSLLSPPKQGSKQES